MTELGRILLFVGGVIILIGAVLVLAGMAKLPIGRLPGDIVYRGKSTVVYFPLATSIIVSLVVSLLFWLFSHRGR